MTRKKPRGLSPDEQALWARVTDTAKPLATPFKPSEKTLTVQPAPGSASRKQREPIPAFRIGETAKTQTRPHDLSPSVSDQVGGTPRVMDKKAHRQMTRGKLKPEGRIDLHGMTVDRAQGALTSFILSSQAQGKRLVLVITGKGRDRDDMSPIPTRTGVLRHQVPGWLSSAPLSGVVMQVTEAHRRHGGSGAFYVYLRRR